MGPKNMNDRSENYERDRTELFEFFQQRTGA